MLTGLFSRDKPTSEAAQHEQRQLVEAGLGVGFEPPPGKLCQARARSKALPESSDFQ